MKNRNRFLIILTAAIFLSDFCLAAETGTVAKKDKAKIVINPALVGLNNFSLDTVITDQKLDGIDLNFLKKTIAVKLDRSGLSIAPADHLSDFDNPGIRVNIDILNFGSAGRYVFRVRTSVSVCILIEKDPAKYFTDEVWSRSSTFSISDGFSIGEAVHNVSLKQLNAFVLDFNYANGNPASTEQNTTVQAQKNRVIVPAVPNQKFIASKNSRVFHKPDCSSVKSISDKNLVYYKNREEAIQSGKRPCKSFI